MDESGLSGFGQILARRATGQEKPLWVDFGGSGLAPTEAAMVVWRPRAGISPHPESLRHIYQFMIRDHLDGDLDRFERRAADRATAGADLPAFRIHRAGLDAARLGRFSGFVCQIALRIGREFCPAAGTAKVVNHAIVLVPMF